MTTCSTNEPEALAERLAAPEAKNASLRAGGAR